MLSIGSFGRRVLVTLLLHNGGQKTSEYDKEMPQSLTNHGTLRKRLSNTEQNAHKTKNTTEPRHMISY